MNWYINNNKIEPFYIYHPEDITNVPTQNDDPMISLIKLLKIYQKKQAIDFFSTIYTKLSSKDKIDINEIENHLISIVQSGGKHE